MENLIERDKKYLWHPLTQHHTHPECMPVSRASGVYIYDEGGKSYIDGISSWYTAVYGHCHPDITRAVAAQITELDQVVFSGFTHRPAVELSEALMSVLPENQAKLFFSDNGSTAVEIGIKMALQYHFNKGEHRTRLIAFEDGFHGDTFGAMSVSGLSVYNGPFESMLLKVDRIPVPSEDNLKAVLNQFIHILKSGEVAAFVYEPLVQGAAAMRMHAPEHLEALLELCREYGVLAVADEVMTGFGKTGTHFASQQLKTKPDIMCMSKALTAGLLPMAVTSCAMHVYEAFLDDDKAKGLFHGHTYTANPPACAAALAGIKLLKSPVIQRNIARIEEGHARFHHSIKAHPKVANSRFKGVIYAMDLQVETSRYGSLRDKIFHYFMEDGIYLRPLGNTVYLVPPYITSEDEMLRLYNRMEALLDSDLLQH